MTHAEAKTYAALSYQRNKSICKCHVCAQAELLAVVQRITANWPVQKKFRRVK